MLLYSGISSTVFGVPKIIAPVWSRFTATYMKMIYTVHLHQMSEKYLENTHHYLKYTQNFFLTLQIAEDKNYGQLKFILPGFFL